MSEAVPSSSREVFAVYQEWLKAGSPCASSLRAETQEGPSGLRRIDIPADRQPSRRLLLTAGIHGDEPAGVALLLKLLTEGGLHPGISWTVVPCLNPSGLRAGTRTNQEGIDLNRDFKYRRCEEVAWFVRSILDGPLWDAHIALHEDWEFQGFYLYELNSGSRPSLAPAILKATGDCIPLVDAREIDGHPLTAPGYIFHDTLPDEPEGWPEAIFVTATWQIRSYTFESPSQLPLQQRILCLQSGLVAAAESLLQEGFR